MQLIVLSFNFLPYSLDFLILRLDCIIKMSKSTFMLVCLQRLRFFITNHLIQCLQPVLMCRNSLIYVFDKHSIIRHIKAVMCHFSHALSCMIQIIFNRTHRGYNLGQLLT